MRVNDKDVPEAAGAPKRESGFAGTECHDVELRMEVVRISDVRRRGTTGDATGRDRLVEIRRQVSSGVYDSAEVRESVARKILDRHDV
jgi:hypothetical protein